VASDPDHLVDPYSCRDHQGDPEKSRRLVGSSCDRPRIGYAVSLDASCKLEEPDETVEFMGWESAWQCARAAECKAGAVPRVRVEKVLR
jgi:hypothetical protein